MFFKSFTAFHLVDYKTSVEDLEKEMQNNLFKECGKFDEYSAGWVPAFGDDDSVMTRNANGCTLVAIKIEERKVKSSALKAELEKASKDEFNKRVAAGVENPKLSKTEIMELKESIHQRMLQELPKSMSNYSLQYAYIDPQMNMLFIDGTSAKRCDGMIGMIRSATDCKVYPAQTQDDMSEVMSGWLKGNLTINPDEGLLVGEGCTLRSEYEKSSTIKYKKQNLDDNYLRGHLKDGHVVADVELTWVDKMNFTLTESFQVKGVRLDSTLKAALADQTEGYDDSDLEIAYFDAGFALMSEEYRSLVPLIAKEFGGFDPVENRLEEEVVPFEE